MLTIKQLYISTISIVILSSIQIYIGFMKIPYSNPLLIFTVFLFLATLVNMTITENEAAYTILNLVMAVISIVSIIRIIGWV
ncbi:hypothetical protein [Providencia huashanensis]